MHRPRSVREADVAGLRVLVRVDFNVPLEDGRVADDTRIRAALPTIELVLAEGAAEVVLMSHLGRPKGPDPAYSLKPVEARLRELLDDERVRPLENTRFDPRETANDPSYARELAANGDVFVNDAFGSAHRAHASTEGVARLLPAYAGLLLLRELQELGSLLEGPERPFVAVLGGAKVEDKIGVLKSLGEKADTVLVGGKMAAEVDREAGYELPADVVAASAFEADAESKVVAWDEVPDGWLALDIGPATRSSSRPASPRRGRSSGTGRWASSSGRASRRARRPSPKPSPARRTRGRSWAGATPCAPSRSWAWPSGSTGSRRAAAHRWSFSKARSSRESPSSHPPEHARTRHVPVSHPRPFQR